MRLKRARRAITLIELLIALAILAAISAVVGINVRSAITTQRFHNSVDRIVQKLTLAQDLMLITNNDCQVIFERKEEVVYCTLRFVGNLTSSLDRLIGTPEAMPQIEGFWFEESSPSGLTTRTEEGVVAIDFFALGRKITRGRLELSTVRDSSGGTRRYIALPGYPTNIRSESLLPDLAPIESAREERSAELFPSLE